MPFQLKPNMVAFHRNGHTHPKIQIKEWKAKKSQENSEEEKQACVCARAGVDGQHIRPGFSEPIPIWEPGVWHRMSNQRGKGDLNIKQYWNYQNGKSKNRILHHDPK